MVHEITQKSRRRSAVCSGAMTALFGVLVLVVGLMVSWSDLSECAMWLTTRSWQEVPCWIDSVHLRDCGDNIYETVAAYSYEFGGQSYKGDRVSIYSESDNRGNFQVKAHAELSRYAVGGESTGAADHAETKLPFRCYVNPKKPSQSVIYRMFRWGVLTGSAILLLFLTTFGALLVSGGLVYLSAKLQLAALEHKHVGEPWKWKLHWVRGFIPEMGHGLFCFFRYALVLLTIWPAMIVFPLIVVTAMSGAFLTDPSAWWLMTLVILWCIPAWCTYKVIRHWLMVGSTNLELKEIPVSPGGVLHGSILLAKSPPSHCMPEVWLVCEKHVTHGSPVYNRSTTYVEKIWIRRDRAVSQDRMIQDVQGFRLPVSIALPADALECSRDTRMLPGIGSDSVCLVVEIIWKLNFNVAGTLFKSTFEIPVFRTVTPREAITLTEATA